jgi:hypothetical protein
MSDEWLRRSCFILPLQLGVVVVPLTARRESAGPPRSLGFLALEALNPLIGARYLRSRASAAAAILIQNVCFAADRRRGCQFALPYRLGCIPKRLAVGSCRHPAAL